jgi:hypothetical protein
MSRLLLGNLDAESDLACLATRWNPRPQRRRLALSRAALANLSGMATLLRAFARPGDRLWTPAPVAPERLPAVPGLPVPELASGPLSTLPPAVAVLAWAETPQVVALRGVIPEREGRPQDELPLPELLWHLRPAVPEVVATVHHRAFALDAARRLGQSLLGARMVGAVAELAEHLGSLPPGPWVVKAPLSAAGRARYVEYAATGDLSAAARQRVERLLQRHGPLLFEPWMERVEDLGSVVLLLPDELWLAGVHRQVVDREGRFQGIELAPEPPGTDLEEEHLLLATTAVLVGRILEQAGYRGPFGIDAYRHRRPDGTIALHPLGEINARMTFGLVARALVERVREPLALDPAARVRLLFGGEIPAGSAVVPLLLPDREGGGAGAWLEID